MNNIKTDILIVGAGAAGIAASLSASESSKHVILAEQLSYVGGLITAGLVTMFCGMEGNESKAIQAVLKETEKHGGVVETQDGPLVNPEIFKIAVEGMLTDRGVKILYNSHAYGLFHNVFNMRIEKVYFRNSYQTFSIEPKVVIDCTGNGDIFYHCGEPFKEYYSKDIPIGLVVRIGGISKEAENYLLSKKGKIRLRELDIPVFERTAMKSIMWTIVNCDNNEYGVKEYENLTNILFYLRRKALMVSLILKMNIWEDSFLLDTAPLIGVRISRLLEGRAKLIGEYTETKMAIADYENKCLLPKYTKNLLIAGRCISADFSVMNRMRVIPACFATGEMAGIAATKLINKGTNHDTISK